MFRRLAPGVPRQPFEEDLSYDYAKNMLTSVDLFVDIAVKRHGSKEIESRRKQADEDYGAHNMEVEGRKRKAENGDSNDRTGAGIT
jgi:hypothetical protein